MYKGTKICFLVLTTAALLLLLSVTMEDPIKEVADLMEGTKEEGWEKSLANKQVTFVVYREGDQLNFFRVVDREHGSLTLLSESQRSAKQPQTVATQGCTKEGRPHMSRN